MATTGQIVSWWWSRLADVLRHQKISYASVTVARGPRIATFRVGLASPMDLQRALSLKDIVASACCVSWARIVGTAGTVSIELPLHQSLWRSLSASEVVAPGFLEVGVGMSTSGQLVTVNLSDPATPHIGVYGVTGSGKSEAVRSIVWQLARGQSEEDLGLVLIDGKARELTGFGSLPHLLHPIVTAPADFGPVLQALEQEIDRRIADPARCDRSLVVAVDEVVAVLRATGGANGPGGEALHRIASLGRGLNVHVVVATHHPTADVMTRLVSASVRVRLCGAVTDDPASSLVMGMSGAAGYQARGLAGHGDMLLVVGDEVTRVQGAMVTEAEMSWLPSVEKVPRLPIAEVLTAVHVSQIPKPIEPAELAVVMAETKRLGRAPGIKRVETLVREMDGECSAARAKRIRGSADRLVEELSRRGLQVEASGASGASGG